MLCGWCHSRTICWTCLDLHISLLTPTVGRSIHVSLRGRLPELGRERAITETASGVVLEAKAKDPREKLASPPLVFLYVLFVRGLFAVLT